MLSFDVDGVLLQGVNEAFVSALPQFGVTFNARVFAQTHSWNQATGLNSQELGRLFTRFLTSSRCPPPAPTTGATSVITRLRGHSTLLALTARNCRTRRVTMQALHSCFAGAFSSGWFGAAGHKHVAIAQRGIMVHVDDSIKEAQRIAALAPGAWVILFPSFTQPVLDSPSGRIINLAVNQQALPTLSSDGREALYQAAWDEVSDTVLNLLELSGVPADVAVA